MRRDIIGCKISWAGEDFDVHTIIGENGSTNFVGRYERKRDALRKIRQIMNAENEVQSIREQARQERVQ